MFPPFFAAVNLYSCTFVVKRCFKMGDLCPDQHTPSPFLTRSFLSLFYRVRPLNRRSCGFASFSVTSRCVFCALLTPFPDWSTYPVSYHLAALCLLAPARGQITHPKKLEQTPRHVPESGLSQDVRVLPPPPRSWELCSGPRREFSQSFIDVVKSTTRTKQRQDVFSGRWHNHSVARARWCPLRNKVIVVK